MRFGKTAKEKLGRGGGGGGEGGKRPTPAGLSSKLPSMDINRSRMMLLHLTTSGVSEDIKLNLGGIRG